MNLESSYNKVDFINYLNDILLPDFKLEERAIGLDNNSLFNKMNYLGASINCEVSVFEAVCDEKDSKKRIAITQNAFRVLRQHGISNAIIAFTYGTKQWRLSLLTSKLELKDGKIISKNSNPRRYSYLLGDGTKTHTPFKYLIDKGRVSSLEDLMQRFSVEVVNKQFYDEVAKHFTELIGGERNGQKYNGLLKIYGVTKPSAKYQEFAIRLIGRIMFCWFLKEKKSMAGMPLITETLMSQNAVVENSDYYHTVLEPLFFELLNTKQKRRKGIFKEGDYKQIPYLNGGLFNPQSVDYYKFNFATNSGENGIITIPDDWFKSLFIVLESYSFTVDENTSYDVELSIDPEMLGRIFENLLAEINPETGESAKKSTGSFYTPRDIVDYMVDMSLFCYLQNKTNISEDKLNAVISYDKDDDNDYPLNDNEQNKIVDALSTLTIIDPACGSGAFPIGILQKVVYILQQIDPNAKLWAEKQYSSVTSAELKQEIKAKQEKGLFDYIRKLGVIRESIFGVDIQTIATEIAKLRCFLSLIVEESVEDDEPNRGIQPLPNLDFKFITANSLVKLDDIKDNGDKTAMTGQISLLEDQTHIDELKRIRDEYFTADPDERIELKTEFKDVQRVMFQTTISHYQKSSSKRYQLLSEWNPFENISTTWFEPEWMFGIQNFDIVIANPPYIHLEHNKELSSFYKNLNFTTYTARGDIYSLFYEKGVELLKQNGFLCYITSNKWMRAAYGESLRQFFSNRINPIQLIDFSGQQIFDATVDTNILLLSKSKNQLSTDAVIVKEKESISNLSVYVKQNSVAVPFNSSTSWTILSPIEQSIKAKIEAVGTPLKDWNIKINRGILTGCNEAFIIDESIHVRLITADPKSAEIIRPILRGRDIKRYGYEFANQYLIASHNGYKDDNGNDILPTNINNYPAIKAHLDEYWDIINIRTDKGATPYNLRNCAYMDDFSKQKIIWGEISDQPKFAFDNGEYMQEATTFLMTGSEPKYLLAFLNSQLSMYFFSKIGTTTGVGTVRWKKFKLEEFPIPQPTPERIDLLIPLVNKLLFDYSPEVENNMNYIIYNIFDFSKEEIDYIDDFKYS